MITGIDAGTSMVKEAAFSRRGEVLAVEEQRVKLYSPRSDCYGSSAALSVMAGYARKEISGG